MSGYITFEERLEIESMIFKRCSFEKITKKINKDRSTISREIRRYFVIEKAVTVASGLKFVSIRNIKRYFIINTFYCPIGELLIM